MNVIEIISLICNVLLTSGLIVTLVTIKSLREKSAAESKTARHAAQKTEIDLVNDLQNSNDFLSKQLDELLHVVVEVKKQNAELKVDINNLRIENEQLRKEVEELSVQLSNIKAIKR